MSLFNLRFAHISSYMCLSFHRFHHSKIHEKTDKIMKNHDFERKFFGVAHFFVILTVYLKMSKDGVYQKRSNPNKETKHSYCENPKSKTRRTGVAKVDFWRARASFFKSSQFCREKLQAKERKR